MILLIAPAPNMRFGAMPSGATYISDDTGLVKVVNDSTADQVALQSAGCNLLTPFGGWGNFGFDALTDLYAADTGAILPGLTGYPRYTIANIFADSTDAHNGTWYKTGTGHGSGNWTQAGTYVTGPGALIVAAAIAAATAQAVAAQGSADDAAASLAMINTDGFALSDWADVAMDSQENLLAGIHTDGSIEFAHGGDIAARLDADEAALADLSTLLPVPGFDLSDWSDVTFDAQENLLYGTHDDGSFELGHGGVVPDRLDTLDTEVAALNAGTSTLAGLKERIAKLARQADQFNPAYRPPLIAPPAWAGSTAYTQGAWVANGGQWYSCAAAGTSAGSGGPTGTGTADITDGTATWHWVGRALITTNDPDAPTVTLQANGTVSGLTNSYARNSAVFHHSAGIPYDVGGNYMVYHCLTNAVSGNNFSGTGLATGRNTETVKIIFDTDAPKITLKGWGSDGGGPRMISVDGRYLGAPIYPGAGSPSHIILDFGGVRKARRIVIEGGPSFRWAGAAVDPLSSIWPPRIAPLRMCWMGDSFGQGAQPIGPHAGMFEFEWPALVAKRLGIEDFWPLSLGGTGFVAQGGGNALYNYLQRAQAGDFAQAVFDVIVLEASVNDGAKVDATITANTLAAIQLARASNANALIFVHGITTSIDGSFFSAVDADVTAGVLAAQGAGDTKVWKIPTLGDTTDGNPWFTGTGNTSAPAGDGNQDIYRGDDGTHPVPLGIEYRARRTANFIRGILET